jgi:AbrB family looped-hinge helix DNA binding protein
MLKSKIDLSERRFLMKAVVTLSSKNQIAIPKSARKKLAIGPGDQLILDVEKDSLILKPKPKSYTKVLRGLHKDVWEGLEATEYVRKERKAWEEK